MSLSYFTTFFLNICLLSNGLKALNVDNFIELKFETELPLYEYAKLTDTDLPKVEKDNVLKERRNGDANGLRVLIVTAGSFKYMLHICIYLFMIHTKFCC
jgi:hypothetical protein